MGDVLVHQAPLGDQQAVANDYVDHGRAPGCQCIERRPRNLDGHEPDASGCIQFRRKLARVAIVVGIEQGIVCSRLVSISNSLFR